MVDYKINGRNVSEPEWLVFCELFGDLPQTTIEQYAGDNELTRDDIHNLLDRNGDHEVTYRDFKGLNSEQFQNLNKILDRHGYRLFKDGNGSISYGDISDAPLFLRSHHGFVLGAVRLYGELLDLADPALKRDKHIVLVAVRQSGWALRYADPALRNDRDVVDMAVRQRGVALQFASELLKGDREIVITATEQDGMSLSYADPALKRDKHIVLVAIRQSGWALGYADPSLRGDREVVITAIKQCGSAIQFADESLKRDRKIVLSAVKQNGWALKHVHPSLKGDREVVITAIKQDGGAIQFADELLKQDMAFMAELAEMNIQIFEHLLPEVSDTLWLGIKNKYTEKLSKAFNRRPKSFADFKQALELEYGIEFVQRFRSIETLLDVLIARKKPSSVEKRIAILIYPTTDYNSALQQFPVVDRLRELGFAVMYYEASDEGSAIDALRHATENGKNKTDVLVLAGHGSETTLDLGRGGFGDDTVGDETRYIDTSDFKADRDDLNLAKYIKIGGTLILNSCSNGQGGKDNPENLANTIANKLPGVRIQSSLEPMNVKTIELDEKGLPVFDWIQSKSYTPKHNL